MQPRKLLPLPDLQRFYGRQKLRPQRSQSWASMPPPRTNETHKYNCLNQQYNCLIQRTSKRGCASQDWTVWTTIVQRIAVEHLLNPPRINFDLEATPFQLEQ